MKSCENCGMPQNRRPGCLVDCICYGEQRSCLYLDYSGFQKKEKENDENNKKSICLDCTHETYVKCRKHNGKSEVIDEDKLRIIECKNFDQKTCGNCYWHKDHKEKGLGAFCELTYKETFGIVQGFYSKDETAAGNIERCQWKPICETCGGSGYTCEHVKPPRDRSLCNPCPFCQKPKEERLMVPVRWRWIGCEKLQAYIQDTEEYSIVIKEIFHEQHIGKFSVVIGDRREDFDTPEQAKQAVEKALGIEKK